MKRRFIIFNEETKRLAKAFIDALPIDEQHYVKIAPYKENRSLEQNALNWVWCTEISNEFGETKNDVHERHKKDFLVPIFERDDEEYASMLEAVRQVHRLGLKKEAKVLAQEIVRLTSTTRANVTQMCEYLTEIERFYANSGFVLSSKNDHYKIAMGKSNGQ